VNIAGGFIAASLAPSTRRIYAQAVEQLRDFAVTMFPGSSWFPTSVPLLCTFVAHLLSTGLAPTSVTSRMSAIAFFHKLFHLHDPTGDFFVRRLLLGAYKQLGTFDVRFPISLSILHQLFASSGHVTQSAYSSCLLRAMYLLMFHAFLRIGEVTKSRNNLLFSQVSILSDSLVIVFQQAKHQYGSHISISVPRSRTSFCPVAALSAYFSLRGPSSGPLFCEPDLSPITPHQFNTWLSLSLMWASLHHLPIKSHSFRIGAATHASAQGYSDSQIQRMGRWKSTAFKRYIRISSFVTF